MDYLADTCLDLALEGSCFVEGGQQKPEGLVCGAFGAQHLGNFRNPLYLYF